MPKQMTLRALKDDLAFVETQIGSSLIPNDTIRLMWEQRRDALREEILATENYQENHARVALTFNGLPVLGSQEIKLDFAAKVLESYQSIVASLAAEKAGAELGARGRLPRTYTSRLFIRDMIRGSVGFLIEEPQPPQSELIPTALKDAVDETTRILDDLSASDVPRFEERMRHLSPRTISAIKKLAKVLHDSGAETQIVDDERELNLDYSGTASLHARLTDLEYVERPETQEGILLGLFPERQQYEFKPTGDAPVFYGPVSEAFDARYLAEPDFARSILLQQSTATFLVSSVVRAGVIQREERILEDIQLMAPKLR
jgi:hypothetical protein